MHRLNPAWLAELLYVRCTVSINATSPEVLFPKSCRTAARLVLLVHILAVCCYLVEGKKTTKPCFRVVLGRSCLGKGGGLRLYASAFEPLQPTRYAPPARHLGCTSEKEKTFDAS